MIQDPTSIAPLFPASSPSLSSLEEASTEPVRTAWQGRLVILCVDPKQKLIAQLCCAVIAALGIALIYASSPLLGAALAAIGLLGVATATHQAKNRDEALSREMLRQLADARPILQNINQLSILPCSQRGRRLCYSIPDSLTSTQWMRGTDQAGQTAFIAGLIPHQRSFYLFPIKPEFNHSSFEIQINQTPIPIQKMPKYFDLYPMQSAT